MIAHFFRLFGFWCPEFRINFTYKIAIMLRIWTSGYRNTDFRISEYRNSEKKSVPNKNSGITGIPVLWSPLLRGLTVYIYIIFLYGPYIFVTLYVCLRQHSSKSIYDRNFIFGLQVYLISGQVAMNFWWPWIQGQGHGEVKGQSYGYCNISVNF